MEPTTLTYEDWKAQYLQMRVIADRVRFARLERARAAALEAGIELPLVHNALVGLHYGQPWKGVNYSKVRLAKRISESMWDSSRIIDRWAARVRPTFPKVA